MELDPELDPDLYTVAWIALLEIEARAALHSLDHRHQGKFPWSYGYDYLFHAGDINGHNVIIATLPSGEESKAASAAALASQIKTFFTNIRIGLLVGIATGIPNLSRIPSRDIRLKMYLWLSQTERVLVLSHMTWGKKQRMDFKCCAIEAPNESDRDIFLPFYESIRNKQHANGTFLDPGQDRDKLFTLDGDGTGRVIKRERRPESKRVHVWYGPIGSGEKIPVGVIRGVCDYGDGHTTKEWQPYAAAMAAAYAKAVLYQILPKQRTPNPSETALTVFDKEADSRGCHDRKNPTETMWKDQVQQIFRVQCQLPAETHY